MINSDKIHKILQQIGQRCEVAMEMIPLDQILDLCSKDDMKNQNQN